LNISETTQDGAIVTIERQYEVICALSNGDLWPRFQVLLKAIISKMVRV